MDLWMSEEDFRIKDRIEFLASYPQTMFGDQLFKRGANLSKNGQLAKGFYAKAEKIAEKQDWSQVLNLTNLSLTFADDTEFASKIVLLRAEAMQKLDAKLRNNLDNDTNEEEIG